MVSKEELENIMANCYGTESYYKYGLIPSCTILLTDGVKAFIDNADAYWFVGDFYSYIPTIRKKAPDEYLFVITLNVKDNKAEMIITDGNENLLLTKEYTYTDCPDGEWKFYYDNDSKVMMYYMEW